MFRIRRSTKRKIGATIVAVMMGAGMFAAGSICGSNREEQALNALLKERTARMDAAERLVYITTREVKAGECFSAENTKQCYLLSEQATEGLATEVHGLVSCGDLGPGVIINTALCGSSKVKDTERECVFEDIGQVECFPDYSMVDVRIRYPNGENYCVLKRKVLRQEEGTKERCRLLLDETEQLLISAARYDVELYRGTELYAVAFREERLQGEAECVYIPSEQVQKQLLQRNAECKVAADWTEKRKALEERLTIE